MRQSRHPDTHWSVGAPCADEPDTFHEDVFTDIATAICWQRCGEWRRRLCLEDALATETPTHRFGVRGGYSAAERDRLANARRRAA